MKSKLYEEAEAAEMLGISVYTLQGIRKAGLISYIQISPRKIKYTLGQIEEYQLKNTRVAA
jgi:predicted site-specific integrase-resolvase